MVVRERSVDVGGDVQIVPVGNGLGAQTTTLDPFVNEVYADAPALDPRVVAEYIRRRDDPCTLLRRHRCWTRSPSVPAGRSLPCGRTVISIDADVDPDRVVRSTAAAAPGGGSAPAPVVGHHPHGGV